jgi:hypothetical protein
MNDDDNDCTLSAYSADTITMNSIPPLTSADLSRYTTIDLTTSGAMGSSGSGSYTISNSSTWPTYGNITIGTGSGSNGSWGNSYYTNSTSGSGSGLRVNSDAEFNGDVKIKGRNIVKLLEKIEDRLAILAEPDPKKLEKFAALKKAYDHYKLMEKLIGDDEDVSE